MATIKSVFTISTCKMRKILVSIMERDQNEHSLAGNAGVCLVMVWLVICMGLANVIFTYSLLPDVAKS